MTAPRVAIPLLLLATLLATGCRRAPQQPQQQVASSGLRLIEVKLGGEPFRLEVADTPESRGTGLMRRDSMPDDYGMLFVFPETEVLGFYMKNTRIPLDIIFLDADRRVISVRQMKPYELRTTSSGRPAKYAIELNQGAAARCGLKEGDLIDLPESAREPRAAGQPSTQPASA